MTRMISDVLDFASTRLAHEGLVLSREGCNVLELCEEAIDEMRLIHPKRPIVLDARDDGFGMWDRPRLVRLVSNLLGNALTYSPPDTGVSVSVSKRDDRPS